MEQGKTGERELRGNQRIEDREREHLDQFKGDVSLVQLGHGVLGVVTVDTGITHQVQVLL